MWRGFSIAAIELSTGKAIIGDKRGNVGHVIEWQNVGIQL